MMNRITVRKRSTGEYLYYDRPCELIGLTNEIITVIINGRMEQLHTDFYYWILSNFHQEFAD